MSSALEDATAAKLPNAEPGKVVTRFAPEPSGYLHIGHLKAALLNAFYARYFKGKMILRFDDTNPSKEKSEFEQSIISDLRQLGVDFEGPTYTSDSIPQLADAMRKVISAGHAYCDDTPAEELRENRMKGIASACREKSSVADNLAAFDEILDGSTKGQTFCVRAKISMTDNNRALRDPVLWRCNVETPHHRHGDKFKSYPTYDFACPFVDSWSGVTHALRANEYADRIPLYEWVQRIGGVRTVTVYEFSRLNFTNTVLSKRKLAWLVATGVVEGWDDPRFPTVRGIMRRGLRPEVLTEFLLEQGASKNTNLMTWDKLWALNCRWYDMRAPRYMAVNADDCVPLTLTDVEEDKPIIKQRPLHTKVAELGATEMRVTRKLLLDHDDVVDLVADTEITLMRFGNVIVREVEMRDGAVVALVGHTHLEGDVKSTTKKLHWIPADCEKFEFTLREYDHIINKRQPEEGDAMEDIVNRDSLKDTNCHGEIGLASIEEGAVVQLERRGFAICDRIYGGKRVFILLPSGKTKTMSKVATKVDAAKLAKGSEDAPASTAEGGHALSKKALKRMAWKAQHGEDAADGDGATKATDGAGV